jgi:hypothetical protein
LFEEFDEFCIRSFKVSGLENKFLKLLLEDSIISLTGGRGRERRR